MCPKQYRTRWALILLTAVILFSPEMSRGWGGEGHRWVNLQAFEHLPPEMAGFRRWAGVVTAQASAADRRKVTDPMESPRHWIDIDAFPEFYQGNLSHDLDSLKAKHGHRLDIYTNGVVPWTVAGVTETLSVAMALGDWNEAVLRAADLGHYVADCHQPLHTTENYDGQLSGNDGVHLRYEINMVDRCLEQLQPDSAQAVYVDDPLEYIFETIPGTWIYVDSIMIADRLARKRSSAYGEEYYRTMWQKTGPFTGSQLIRAARVLADLWYTAWVDAGRPEFPPPATAAAIADLQGGSGKNDLVTVQGVVTIGSDVLGAEQAEIYIQDGSGRGIRLFDETPLKDILRGDLLMVEGLYQDYRGTMEITGPCVKVLERGCQQPPPEILSTGQAADSRWDNTLIQVRGTVVFTLEGESWTRLHVDDGSGAVVVMVRRETGIDLTPVREGDVLTISGVCSRLADEGSRAIMPGYPDQMVWEGRGAQ